MNPVFDEFAGTEAEAIEFVMRTNKRRNLASSQWAAIAVESLPLLEAAAKKRQIRKPVDSVVALIPQQIEQTEKKSRDIAAKQFNTSSRYVSDAKKLKQNEPELFEEVKKGKKTITQAKRDIKERNQQEKRSENQRKITLADNPENLDGVYSTIVIDDGCRDPLVVWGDILIDGHNRHEICTRNNINFNIVHKEFECIDSALEWVGNNQLGRRNLTPDQFKLLIGRKYNRLKSQGKRNDLTSDQNEQKLEKSDAIANEHRVSRATVVRAGAAAEAIDKQGVPELKEIVQSGNVSINGAATVATFERCG